jgi:hypothetical protein
MKKSLIVGLIVLSMVLCSAMASMASVYQFNVNYGKVGTADVDYVAGGYDNNKKAHITDFLVTSSQISLDSSRAAYCVDIYDSISRGDYYGVLLDITTAVSDPSGNLRDYSSAATLLEQYGAAYDADNDSDEEQLQLSIWETLYEDSNAAFSLASGDFSSDDYGFLTLGTGFDISQYKVLRFTDASGNFLNKQDLLVKVNSVPIPGTAWLLGSGLFGLIGIMRRRQS